MTNGDQTVYASLYSGFDNGKKIIFQFNKKHIQFQTLLEISLG